MTLWKQAWLNISREARGCTLTTGRLDRIAGDHYLERLDPAPHPADHLDIHRLLGVLQRADRGHVVGPVTHEGGLRALLSPAMRHKVKPLVVLNG
jgi:hypothetical protein